LYYPVNQTEKRAGLAPSRHRLLWGFYEEGIVMHTCTDAKTCNSGMSATRLTTLYDLMAEMTPAKDDPGRNHGGPDTRETAEAGRISSVAEQVARMFASGRITFQNPTSVKRTCAELFI
jgi:hypothetical protein